MIPIVLAIVAALVGAWGALSDIRHRILPNLVCLLFAIACAGRLGMVDGWSALASSAIHMLVVLAVGLPLFALRWLGGGDVKFYAAAALGVPLAQGTALLLWTSVAGVILTIGLMTIHLRKAGMPAARRVQVPFGVAIFAGYMLATLPR